MACGRQPTCGDQGAATGTSGGTILGDILMIFSIIGGIATVVALLEKLTIVTVLGVSGPLVLWLAAIAGALITFGIVFDFYRLRCLASPRSLSGCSAGVIERTVPSFDSAWNEVFPFTAMHDRVDVVVKCVYWFLVENAAAFIHCNTDPDMSPLMRGYYKSSKVCGAGLGATIGAGIGAAAGIFLGVLAGGAIASAFCGPLVGLCLILACLIALIVAAVCVLVGALVGGQIGKAAASGGAPAADTGQTLSLMDYVTTKGSVITSGDDDGARVYWFVTSTTLHGASTLPAPHSHTDPDTTLTMDACPVVGTG